MRYKIYFFLFACNVLFGSVSALYTVDSPIPYEEWKTASYEDVAKEVALAILDHYKTQLEARAEAIPDEEEKFCEDEEELSELNKELSTIRMELEELQNVEVYSTKKKKLIEDISRGMSACTARVTVSTRIDIEKNKTSKETTKHDSLIDDSETTSVGTKKRRGSSRAIAKKKIKICAGNMLAMPHIALARLVDRNNNKVYPLPYIFISGTDFEGALQKKLKAFYIKQPKSIFSYVPSEKIKKNCGLMYAHSERAIFETLLSLCPGNAPTSFKPKSLILQIKNSLPMCENCQNLWLNKSYQNSLGVYVGKMSEDKNTDIDEEYEDSPWEGRQAVENNHQVNVWAQASYLQRVEAFADIKDASSELRHEVVIDNFI